MALSCTRARLDIGKNCSEWCCTGMGCPGRCGAIILEVFKERVDVALRDVVSDVVVTS